MRAGTHDNSTTAGWWADDANDADRALLKEYAGFEGGDLAWFMIRLAMESVARTSIFSMQVSSPLGFRIYLGLRFCIAVQWVARTSTFSMQVSPVLRTIRRGHD